MKLILKVETDYEANIFNALDVKNMGIEEFFRSIEENDNIDVYSTLLRRGLITELSKTEKIIIKKNDNWNSR